MAKSSLAARSARKKPNGTSTADSSKKSRAARLSSDLGLLTEALLIQDGNDIKFRFFPKPHQVRLVSAESYDLVNISLKRNNVLQELCKTFPDGEWWLRCMLSGRFFQIRDVFCGDPDERGIDDNDHGLEVTFGIVFEEGSQLSDASLSPRLETRSARTASPHVTDSESLSPVGTPADLGVEERQAAASLVSRKSRHKKRRAHLRTSNITTSRMSVSTASQVLLQLTVAKEGLSSFQEYFKFRSLKLSRVLGIGGFGVALAVKNNAGEIHVLKLIPLTAEKIVHILREVLITDQLHELRLHDESASFPKYYGCAVIAGGLDPLILSLLSDSENGEGFMEAKVTKWLALELEYGGDSLQQYARAPEGHLLLEHHGCAVSILFQTLLALAAAEEMLDFEHRDCHWENILILKNANVSDLVLHIDGQTKFHEAFGLSVMIIDFGLSRCRTGHGVEYLDLNRYFPGVLKQSGTVQYEVYRKTHEVLGGFWDEFNPRTNALWIEYLIDKLLHRVAYSSNRSSKHILILETLFKGFRENPPSSAEECLRHFSGLI